MKKRNKEGETAWKPRNLKGSFSKNTKLLFSDTKLNISLKVCNTKKVEVDFRAKWKVLKVLGIKYV